MPNAREMQVSKPNFLLLGAVGAGKTPSMCSLPGKKFIYNFDPGGLESVRGLDVDYEEFLPKEVSTKMAGGKGDVKSSVSDTIPPLSQRVYNLWEADFEARLDMGWFTDPTKEYKGLKGGIDVLGFDSASTWTDMIIEELQMRSNRVGLPPDFEHEFHTAMNLIGRIMRAATSLGISVVMCVHERPVKDAVTQRLISELMLVGQLRQKLPMLFSEIYHLESRNEGGKTRYKVLTRPDSIYQTCRTRIGRGIFDTWEDVTIDWSKPIEGQGLAALMKKAGGVK